MSSDSDVIRSEIENTAARIRETVRILEGRSRRAARSAMVWVVASAAAAGLVTVAAVVLRRRHRRLSARATGFPVSQGSHSEARLPFRRIGITGRRAEPRSTA
jgi:hypothetical protein